MLGIVRLTAEPGVMFHNPPQKGLALRHRLGTQLRRNGGPPATGTIREGTLQC